jgi:hypothetical protein
MKLVEFVLLFGRSRLVRSGNLPSFVMRASGCAAVGLLCLLPTFQAWSAECVPTPSGLVSLWHAEGDASDSVDAANGTLSSGVTFAPGQVGQCFAFKGVNGVVSVPDVPALALTNSLTIECWVFVTNAPSVPGMILFRGDNRADLDPYYLHVSQGANGSTVLGLVVHDAANNGIDVSSLMPTGAWTHVAATLEDATGLLTLYTNGWVGAQTHTTVRPLGRLSPSSSPGVGIGNVQAPGQFNFPFKGRIDELSVYNRALSAAEIQGIYNAGSAGKCGPPCPYFKVQPRSQVGYWGKSVSFTVTAGGDAPLSYQWQKDTVPIAGATGSSLVLTNLQMADEGNYSVVVTNDCGTNTSSNAYLTMNPAGVSLALYPGVTIDGVVGLTYGIQYTTDLSNTNSWQGLVNVPLSAPTMLWFDTQPAMSQPQRYYRVVPGPISIP